ncbi:MAG: DUF4911 domain-containing protein [Deltaproteobacteria bacterium]|nr:DUF4911 domain-containing protein [Candidatus Anaeroferrophillus wilburensis]MBN2888476.1 DUF4911 domain-containing protein [Deltaproteobacteria bacterium]
MDSKRQAHFFLCHVASDRIAMLCFLLEGYDGLATMSTISVREALVCCTVPHGCCPIFLLLFRSLVADGLIISFMEVKHSALELADHMALRGQRLYSRTVATECFAYE